MSVDQTKKEEKRGFSLKQLYAVAKRRVNFRCAAG